MAIVFSTLVGVSMWAQAISPSWVRYTALSPKGDVIAFSYKGDIFTVPIAGGLATQITSHPSYDKSPVWSPDGETLAFASDREGNFNVYITSKVGGKATRLTFNSRNQVPVAFNGNDYVIYEANIRPDVQMGLFPSGGFSQLYSQSVKGGRPEVFSAWSMIDPSIGADGRILFTDIKGYEDKFRKHHTSSITRDIWMFTPAKDGGVGSYKKLTSFEGEDRNALWLPGQKEYLYTSEKDGTLNIYKSSIDADAPTQLTTFTKHPVRYMSMDQSGNVAFSWNGKLYYMPLGGAPREVPVSIIADYDESSIDYQTLSQGATDFELSPNEKEVALIVRGDVFVANIEYGTTKRITNTPEQERSLTISPDGRKIVYAAERDGQWNLYMTELVRKDDKLFSYAVELKETQLTDGELPSFQPIFSPDGKEIAFLRDRSAIYVLNLDTKLERMVMEKKYNYSYQDGDQDFAWSPDGKWIITEYIGIGGWNNRDVAIIKADGSGTSHNLTESGYSDGGGRFVMGGKAIVFASDRAGYRSHGSWGAEYDLYMMFLDSESYDQFMLDKEERELFKPEKDEDKKEDDSKKKDKKGKKEKKEKAKTIAPLTFDLENRDYRTVRLTRNSGRQSDFVMTPKGDMLYYLASFDNSTNLYSFDMAEKKTEMVLPNVGSGSLRLGKDGKTLYLFSYRGGKKIEGKKVTPIKYEARFEHQPAKERAYIFDHVVKQTENKFYDVKMHGVDWQGYATEYRKFLPHINNNYDFAEMLSELLGELNASHTGARYSGNGAKLGTASLGLFYDETYKGEGVKIAEVMKGGPMDKAKSIAKPGVIILKVNGETIAADKPLEYYLNGMAGRWVQLTLKDPKGKEVEESIRPISIGRENQLLYRRWVAQREEMVKEWSKGKIGYVHVEGMDSPSFRKVFKDLLGKYRHCDAVVVDTRFNGGGWLHEDLVILLSGKEYSRFTPRGQYIGSDPFGQWNKPSVVLMSEGNYSNAHGFPWVYKHLGIGKLVGAPVPGTMTAVWWETQVDPSIVFGIPQTTVSNLEGKALENELLEPDILVYNTPEENLQNIDAQLKAAVEALMK